MSAATVLAIYSADWKEAEGACDSVILHHAAFTFYAADGLPLGLIDVCSLSQQTSLKVVADAA